MKKKKSLSAPQMIILSFFALVISGGFLLMLPVSTTDGKGLSLIDAMFTSTSAVCVTGLTVIDVGNKLSIFGQIVLMLWIQFGGLGLMTISTVFIVALGWKIGLGNRLLMQEALNQYSFGGIIKLTKKVILYTAIVELTGAFILGVRFSFDFGIVKGFYFGLWHSVSAFNNAGFDLLGNFKSLTGYADDFTINLTIMALIIVGGIGFSVINDVFSFKDKKRPFYLNTKMVLSTTAWLIVGGALLLLIIEMFNPATMGGMSWHGRILAAFFQSVTPRTAGFNSLDLPAMHTVSMVILIFLMFVGASPNSTGGGIKTTSFAVVLGVIRASVKDYDNVEMFGRTVPRWVVQKAVSVTFLGAAWVLMIVCLLSFTESMGFLELLFETVSAFGTVGLTIGATLKLSTLGKLAIMATMFVGRVGPLTFALALSKKSIAEGKIIYPEEKILVG